MVCGWRRTVDGRNDSAARLPFRCPMVGLAENLVHCRNEWLRHQPGRWEDVGTARRRELECAFVAVCGWAEWKDCEAECYGDPGALSRTDSGIRASGSPTLSPERKRKDGARNV